MNAHKLEADTSNAREIVAARPLTLAKMALWFYRDRLAEGYPPSCAYVMALCYLRRKSGLSVPLAMAALDSLMEDVI